MTATGVTPLKLSIDNRTLPRFVNLEREKTGPRKIGPLSIDVRSYNEARDEVLKGASDGRPMMVAFANAHSVNLASGDDQFRRAMEEGLVLNDGVGIDIASKLLFGDPFPANLNGTDFIPGTLAASGTPLRLFLIGGGPGIAQLAGSAIEKACPNVTVVGALSGYFDLSEEEHQLHQIQESGANMLLIGLGQPLQELWARRHWRNVSGPCVCVGGLFDFLAQRLPRAPRIIRRLRLEWAFRLAMEPRRLANRYLIGNVKFIAAVARQRMTDQAKAMRDSTLVGELRSVEVVTRSDSLGAQAPAARRSHSGPHVSGELYEGYERSGLRQLPVSGNKAVETSLTRRAVKPRSGLTRSDLGDRPHPRERGLPRPATTSRFTAEP
ncbi:MAG: hypothetical protein NVS3B5_06470 [Sphingomicrobium sp.]